MTAYPVTTTCITQQYINLIVLCPKVTSNSITDVYKYCANVQMECANVCMPVLNKKNEETTLLLRAISSNLN